MLKKLFCHSCGAESQIAIRMCPYTKAVFDQEFYRPYCDNCYNEVNLEHKDPFMISKSEQFIKDAKEKINELLIQGKDLELNNNQKAFYETLEGLVEANTDEDDYESSYYDSGCSEL